MNFKRFHESKNLFSCNIEQGTISAEGVPRSADNRVRSDDFIIMETGEYTINALSESGILRLFIFEYMEDGTFVSRTPADWTNIPYTFSLTGKRKMKFIFSYISENITPTMVNSVMLNLGSQPLPYEPYSSEVWHDIPHYIHNTSTDTITTLPADLYADGNNATVGLVGNMYQASGVSPDNPIQPQETGERTGNLFDKNNTTIYSLFPGTGDKINVSSHARSIAIPCVGGETYTVSKKAGQRFMVCFTTEPIANQVAYTNLTVDNTAESITATAPSDAKYLFVYFYNDAADVDTIETLISSIMLNTGSTPLPYEPYGFKIPISSANTTTPVYLGEVETTRKVKKYEFTGQETISQGLENYYTSLPALGVPYSNMYCTHNVYGACSVNNIGGSIWLKISSWSDYATAEDLKAFFQQEYAAGTPVTVWYVLANPETAVVNEPLRKIGDYADTISNVAEIPTTAGEQTFDVDTSLKPSSVEITYKGWHKHTPKEYDNGSWS